MWKFYKFKTKSIVISYNKLISNLNVDTALKLDNHELRLYKVKNFDLIMNVSPILVTEFLPAYASRRR